MLTTRSLPGSLPCPASAGLSRSHRAGLVADGVASEEAAEGETGSRFSMERLASEDARSMRLARADDDFFF